MDKVNEFIAAGKDPLEALVEPLSHEQEMENFQEEVTEELFCCIGDLKDDEAGSTVRDLQPPESVVRAMAVAAAQVLIAFERGYRIGG